MDHYRMCGPSLTETSLCGPYLYNKTKEVEIGKRCSLCGGDVKCTSYFGHKYGRK